MESVVELPAFTSFSGRAGLKENGKVRVKEVKSCPDTFLRLSLFPSLTQI
jgi:hypothetical protein